MQHNHHAAIGSLFARLAAWGTRNPIPLARCAVWAIGLIWRMRHGLVVGRGRVNRLSFFIHDFMDACCLDRDRIGACSFMVATADGPLSMCLHNAKRDEFILQRAHVATQDGAVTWDPLTGAVEGEGGQRRRFPRKGRARL